MNPINIAQALQLILDLTNAIKAAHAAGSAVIPANVWEDAVAGRKQDQAKLDADIAAAKAAGL